MSRSVSFLRRITFKAPSSHTPIWIKQADLYEDQSRIYAFLTFENKEKSPIERVKIRITPFDEGKFGMDPFGIQILNLSLKPGASKEHRDPLLLPKGTYGFNFSIVSYGLKRKASDVEAPSLSEAPASMKSAASASDDALNDSAFASPEATNEAVSRKGEAPKEPAQEGLSSEAAPKLNEQPAQEAKEEARGKNPNRAKPLGKMPALAIVLLLVLGVAVGYLLFLSGIWGKNLKF